MTLKVLTSSAAALAMIATPALAAPVAYANPATALSASPAPRVGSPTHRTSKLTRGGAITAALIAAGVIAIGVVAGVNSGNDSPDSP